MQAWILEESPGSYRFGTIDHPPVGAGDVAVRPVASALNHMDLWLTGASHGRRCPTCRAATWPASWRSWATASTAGPSATRSW